MKLINMSVKHLRDNHMTYYEHFIFATSHGLLCCLAGTMLIVHAVLPCFFQQAGSTLVRKLKLSFDKHRKQI